MIKKFDNSSGKPINILECIKKVLPGSNPISLESLCYVVRLIFDNSDAIEFGSYRILDEGDSDSNFYTFRLNKDITKAYKINLNTGSVRWKYVTPKAREEYLKDMKEMGCSYVRITNMTRDDREEDNFNDGETTHVVRVDIHTREDVPIELLLEHLTHVSCTHPYFLYNEKTPLDDYDKSGQKLVIRKIKEIVDTLNEDMPEEDFAYALCVLTKTIWSISYRAGLPLIYVWKDYCDGIKTGSVLRTKDILETLKLKSQKENPRRL